MCKVQGVRTSSKYPLVSGSLQGVYGRMTCFFEPFSSSSPRGALKVAKVRAFMTMHVKQADSKVPAGV